MVKVGNGYYFMFIGLAAIYFAVIYFALRNKTQKTKWLVLLILTFVNLGLHFLKLAFEPYRSGLPATIRKSTFENICAVSTMLFPFVYLMKKQNILHDYFFFIGVCGGLGAMFYPTEALGKFPFVFDVLRFYFCHANLFVVPILACVFGIYRPRVKYCYLIPVFFLLQLVIILVNEIILIKIGWVSSTLEEMLDHNIRNSSFIFGLTDGFKGVSVLIDPLVPKVFVGNFFNLDVSISYYAPILWLVIPCIIYLPIVYIIITSPIWITQLVISKKKLNQKC